jgi:hypothetical protein
MINDRGGDLPDHLRMLRIRWHLPSSLGALIAGSSFAVAAGAQPAPAALAHPAALTPIFERSVVRRIDVPDEARADYAQRLARVLAGAGVTVARTQFVVVVDRSASVQVAMIWWIAADGSAGLIGAVPVSTGLPAGFEHFETPVGVFEHALGSPDFRAEGTANDLGVRGYGERGRRVFDFGWVDARRGWAPGSQLMRLQLHATDPLLLEPRLGRHASKGCIRVGAGFNELLDRYGILDAAYDEAVAAGKRFWVLRGDRIATPWAGRWLVIVDSERTRRPDWARAPTAARAPARTPALQDPAALH